MGIMRLPIQNCGEPKKAIRRLKAAAPLPSVPSPRKRREAPSRAALTHMICSECSEKAPQTSRVSFRGGSHTSPAKKIMEDMVEYDFEGILSSPIAHKYSASLPRRLRGDGIEG